MSYLQKHWLVKKLILYPDCLFLSEHAGQHCILYNFLTQSSINTQPFPRFLLSQITLRQTVSHVHFCTCTPTVWQTSRIGIARLKGRCAVDFNRLRQGPSCRGQSWGCSIENVTLQLPRASLKCCEFPLPRHRCCSLIQRQEARGHRWCGSTDERQQQLARQVTSEDHGCSFFRSLRARRSV